MAQKPAVAVAGIGRTTLSRNSGRTTLAMAAEAGRQALDDAGLDPRSLDGVVTYAAGDSALGVTVAHAVGADELTWCLDLHGGGNVATAVVTTAAHAIQAGLCETVLVYRSMNGRSGRRFGSATGVLTLEGEAQFDGPSGYLFPPQWMAMWARVHQQRYGSTAEDLGAIAVAQRDHAVGNPWAIARDPLTLENYLDSRFVHEPLRLYDCTFEVDGAAAIVLTSAERAKDLRQPLVEIEAAVESHSGGGSWDQWPDPTTMYSAKAGPRLWREAGLRPHDIDLACMYDCFTYTVMATLEDYGFCGKGEVGDFYRAGAAGHGGEVVVNPHGGLLSEGYLHGINHHYEAVLQLRGQALDRQVRGAGTALVTAGAGPYGGAVVYRAASAA